MLEKLTAEWKEYVGNNRINVSGELILNDADPAKLLVLSEEEEKRILGLVGDFAKAHQNFKVTTLKGVGEFDIKIFVCDVYTAKTTFMETFRDDLANFVHSLLENKNLVLRLNVFGDFSTKDTMQKFRYLNKGEQVEYKITDTLPVSMLARVLCRSVRMYLLIVLVIAILVWQESLIK